ncbi:hypothetical protein EYC84_004394 [Monilinia fructicola]|uniref:Uncharacterized protein n=1 Tax=Monilinia fructicola TaxID=38448 RepID=A0A5M9K313_MONFR|nr:hypothetical protein EYC84_004394 [Monilinia fructicola]
MFAETPSPTTTRKPASRIPSAYRSSPSFDRISEASDFSNHAPVPPSPSRSSYFSAICSTQLQRLTL